MVESLSSIQEALGSIPGTKQKQDKRPEQKPHQRRHAEGRRACGKTPTQAGSQ